MRFMVFEVVTGSGFCLNTSVVLCHYYSTNAPQSYFIHLRAINVFFGIYVIVKQNTFLSFLCDYTHGLNPLTNNAT